MSSRPAVLCISSQQFGTDLGVLDGTIPDISWLQINDLDLMAAQREWWPARMQEQTIYAYETGAEAEAVWERARATGAKIISNAMKEHDVLAVMAGNFDYWGDEALRLGCEALGIPFLTLLREHFLTADDYEDGLGYQGYRLQPKTAGVAVAGELSRQTLTKFNIIPDSKIRVTGFPRFDLWFTPPKPLYERPVVLLSYLKGYGAEGHFYEMVRLFSETANRHPNIPFVLKAKHGFEHKTLKAMTAQFGSAVQVIHTPDMPNLLRGARAIIGYNSLSVFEGLLTSSPIFVPQWGEALRPWKSQAPCPIDPRLKDHMVFIPSAEEMTSALESAIAGTFPVSGSREREETFSKYVYHTRAEPACFRVVNFIREFSRGG